MIFALLSLSWVGWIWGSNVLNSRAEAQAQSCSEGQSFLRVAVTPSVERPVTAAAKKWNATDQVVHDHCVTVEVSSINSEVVLNNLHGRGTVGGVPAAWIPESTWWADELASGHPDRVAGQPVSITSARAADYPLVAISGEGVDNVQERAAQKFRTFLLKPDQQALFTEAGFSG